MCLCRSPVRLLTSLTSHRPVGFVVAFLRRARRSRLGAGWSDPRIMSVRLWPVGPRTVGAVFDLPTIGAEAEKQRV